MRSIVLLFAFASASVALAGPIQLHSASLGINVFLGDSKAAKPVRAIADATNGNYEDLVDGINAVIAHHTLHCAENGLADMINAYVGCDWRGFEVLAAKILPYRVFLPGQEQNTSLALVIKGKTTRQDESTFFIPVEFLVNHARSAKPIHWWFSNGGVRSNQDYLYNRVDVSRIFSN